MAADANTFAALQSLAQRYTISARNLPAQVDITPVRTVVCFQVLGQALAIPLEELVELLEVPPCTRLPRVKPWVKGIANVRGKLLPVVDFAAYLGGRLQAPPKQQRVLVLDFNGIFVGLLVDEVKGARHFRVDTYDANAGTLQAPMQAIVEGRFCTNEGNWLLFRPLALIEDRRFTDVAA